MRGLVPTLARDNGQAASLREKLENAHILKYAPLFSSSRASHLSRSDEPKRQTQEFIGKATDKCDLNFCKTTFNTILPSAEPHNNQQIKKRPTYFPHLRTFNPNRSLDFGEIARLCHAACFSLSRRRSGLRRGVARNRMRTEAGKMPESLTFPIKNGLGASNDRFGLKPKPAHNATAAFQKRP